MAEILKSSIPEPNLSQALCMEDAFGDEVYVINYVNGLSMSRITDSV